jgi:hypothetical protein
MEGRTFPDFEMSCQLMESLSACVDRVYTKTRGRTGGSSAFAEYEDVPLSSLKKVT